MLNRIRMFYFLPNTNTRKYRYSETSDDTTFVFPASRYDPIPDSLGVLANGYIFATTWYIEYPNGDIDTLDNETTKLNCDDAMANRCHCVYPLTKVVFNGKIAPEVTDIQSGNGKPIFLFEK